MASYESSQVLVAMIAAEALDVIVSDRETVLQCANTDEVLEYMAGEDRLRDFITQVTGIERTI